VGHFWKGLKMLAILAGKRLAALRTALLVLTCMLLCCGNQRTIMCDNWWKYDAVKHQLKVSYVFCLTALFNSTNENVMLIMQCT